MPSVEAQLLLKAAATATDQGSFTAIAAAYTLDRDKERILPGAFADTIKAWQDRNRPIPLHWAHKGDAEYVIGSVDPATMRETDEGLYVEGQLDLEGSDLAKEAWRLVKADTVSLSFGFLGEVTPTAKDGTREITNIDLFEVSLTPAPANPDTRFLSIKSAKTPDDPPAKSPEQVQRGLDDMRLDMAAQDLPDVVPPEPEPEQNPVAEVLERLSGDVELLLAERKKAQEKSPEEVQRGLDDMRLGMAAGDLPEAQPEPEVHKVKQLASLLRDRLQEAGDQRFGASQDIYVSVEDYDPDQGWAVFGVFGGTPNNRYVQVGYTTTADEVVLATDETEVERITQFRPMTPDVGGKNADVTDKETEPGSRSVDPLRKRADDLALEVASGGVESRKPPKVKEQPRPQPELELRELRARSRTQMLELLSGIEGER